MGASKRSRTEAGGKASLRSFDSLERCPEARTLHVFARPNKSCQAGRDASGRFQPGAASRGQREAIVSSMQAELTTEQQRNARVWAESMAAWERVQSEHEGLRRGPASPFLRGTCG